jgi:FkbM family methyltransferase
MKQLLYHAKEIVQRTANHFGYRIERLVDVDEAPLDVLDLAVHRLMAERPDLFFLQIGAHDGVCDDPLRKYVTRYHWRGLLVEPQPKVFARLVENYRGEPQLRFENAAVAERDGTRTLYAIPEGVEVSAATCLATFNPQVLRDRVGYRVPIEELTIPALSLPTLLGKHGVGRVDLLQIDTEGYDYEILKTVDFEKVRPTVIHFEHLLLSQLDKLDCFRLLARHGYRLSRQGINTLAYLQG